MLSFSFTPFNSTLTHNFPPPRKLLHRNKSFGGVHQRGCTAKRPNLSQSSGTTKTPEATKKIGPIFIFIFSSRERKTKGGEKFRQSGKRGLAMGTVRNTNWETPDREMVKKTKRKKRRHRRGTISECTRRGERDDNCSECLAKGTQ